MKIISISAAPLVKRQYGIMQLIAGPNAEQSMKTSRVDVKILEIDAMSQTSKHYHLESDSIFLVIDGEAELETLDQCEPMKPGDAARVPPREFHMLRNTTQHKCKVLEIMSPPYRKEDLFYE